MKSRDHSLVFILTKSYLLFTVTLFLIIIGLYWGWNAYTNQLYVFAAWDKLIADKNLEKEHYERLLGYIKGEKNKFAVFDTEGKLVFSSDSHWNANFTLDEISCIKEYNGGISTDIFYYIENGKTFYQIVKLRINADNIYEKIADMVLDENYYVIEGGIQEGKRQYTPKEFELLISGGGTGDDFFKYPFINQQGEQRFLLFKTSYLSDKDVNRLYQESWKIWWLFIPMYILTTVFFIWRLRKNILTPLNYLHRAVMAQSTGHILKTENYRGPREIVEIGKSFSSLTISLAESEKKRNQLDQERQKLIADISHDLKTPITVIAGYVKALCDGKVPPDQERNYLAVIQGRAKTLTELIDAFHEYSKVEHPEFILHLEQTDICEYFREYLVEKYDEIELAGFFFGGHNSGRINIL